MRIAILNLSARFEALDQYGDTAEQIERWIGPSLPDAKMVRLDIAGGTLLPCPSDFDGYILSGSEKGVYDDVPWMEPLKQFLESLRHKHIPVFGICFGHQIMAEAYGGKAEKADKGFVVGVRDYIEDGKRYLAYAMHQDQVVQIPSSATITASATYCPVAALSYDFPARSVQFHPEFEKPFVDAAIDVFEGNLFTTEESQEARGTLASNSVDNNLLATEVAQFFRQQVSSGA